MVVADGDNNMCFCDAMVMVMVGRWWSVVVLDEVGRLELAGAGGVDRSMLWRTGTLMARTGAPSHDAGETS